MPVLFSPRSAPDLDGYGLPGKMSILALRFLGQILSPPPADSTHDFHSLSLPPWPSLGVSFHFYPAIDPTYAPVRGYLREPRAGQKRRISICTCARTSRAVTFQSSQFSMGVPTRRILRLLPTTKNSLTERDAGRSRGKSRSRYQDCFSAALFHRESADL